MNVRRSGSDQCFERHRISLNDAFRKEAAEGDKKSNALVAHSAVLSWVSFATVRVRIDDRFGNLHGNLSGLLI